MESMNEEFVVIQFPEAQSLMDKEGFDGNSYLINDEKGIKDFGPCAYFVRKSWFDSNIERIEDTTKNILTKEEFFTKIDEKIKKMPECHRKGQKVFNAVDIIFGVARDVQFQHKIDCFHNDENIEAFKEKSYEVYKQYMNNLN